MVEMKNTHLDDFAELEPTEAQELAELAEQLRNTRYDEGFDPNDDRYWANLNQKIMNQIAVTSLPKKRSLFNNLWSGLFGQRKERRFFTPAFASIMAAVVTLVVILLLSQNQAGDQDLLPLESPEFTDNTDNNEETETAIARFEIPDELWEDGFFIHRTAEMAEADLFDWEYDDVEEDDEDELLLFSETASYLDDESNALWGLNDLTLDELVELEGMLDG